MASRRRRHPVFEYITNTRHYAPYAQNGTPVSPPPSDVMSRSPEDILALTVGASTVGENLQRGIELGALLQNQDGTLEFRRSAPIGLWLSRGHMPACAF